MNRGVGVLIGIAAGWASTVLFNLGSARLLERRAIRFNNDLADSLPWLLLVATAAAIVGLLGLFARQLPGGLFGAGLFMTGLGLVLAVVPIRTAFDISRIIDFLEKRAYGSLQFDGTLVFVGLVLLGAGIGALLPERAPQLQPQQQYYSPSQPPGQFPG